MVVMKVFARVTGGCTMGSVRAQLPVIVMLALQFIYAAMILLNKAVISSGMKPSVFISYRQALATLALAPFAYFSQRKIRSPPLTFYLLFKIWLVASFGMALSLNLHYVGLNYVSATFATALTNTIPAMVFIIAICFRIESLAIKEKQGWAKIVGSILGLGGAMVYTFYKGPPLYSAHHPKQSPDSIDRTYSMEEWIKGSLIQIVSNLAWAFWLIMQTPILKEYPTKLQLMTLQSGFSGLSTTVYAVATERNISSWKLGWNVNLLSVAYCGIAVTALSYSLQVWAVEKRGPVFTAIFSPLALILTTIFSAIFFHETLHWGGVLGAVLLVGGLYAFLWGKNKEVQISGDVAAKDEEGGGGGQLESIVVASKPPVNAGDDAGKT